MKPSPADHSAADLHERLVDVVAAVEAGAEAAELVPQRDGMRDHVPQDPDPAAVGVAAAGDGGADAAAGQGHPPLLVVVGAVAHHLLGLAERGAALAPDW